MPNVKKSILQPKNDVVFKALFSRGKPRITQDMLEAILKMKIDRLELDKSIDLLNDNKDDKNGRLDLRAVMNGNTECDIEVQLASNDNIAERFVYYWAKMYAANLKIGDTYSDLRKTISIIILDDTTSAVDMETETLIQDELSRLKNSTVFIIAHRISSIKDADLILVLENGHIIEQGNHDELLAKGGYYSTVFSHQKNRSLKRFFIFYFSQINLLGDLFQRRLQVLLQEHSRL